MIVPFLKSNGKYSLYNTSSDFKPGNPKHSQFGANINTDSLYYNEFDFIDPFYDGIAIAKKGEVEIYIDKKGYELRTKHKYYQLRNFENGIAPVCRDYKVDYPQWRFINKNGIEIIDDAFEEYQFRDNGYIEVTKYSGYAPSGYDNYSSLEVNKFSTGILHVSGNMILEPSGHGSFSFYENFISKYIFSQRESRKYYFNYTGEQLFDKKFNQFEYIGDTFENRGIAQLKNTSEYVIINDDLEIIKNLGIYNHQQLGESYYIFPNKFGQHFFGQVCPIKIDGKWGLINYEGDLILAPKYDFIGGFTDIKEWKHNSYGCTVVGKLINSKMKYAAINYRLEEIVGFDFDEIELFHEGIASVRIENRWGAINSMGKIVVPIEYNHISYCNNGFIEVGLGDYDYNNFVGHFGFYSKSGIKITKVIYEYLSLFHNGFAVYKKHGKYGILDASGKETTNKKYDSIRYIYETIFLAELDEIRFYIDANGREFRHTSS